MIKQFHDAIELKGKHATIMRDGIYLYMPSEIGINDGRDPNKPVQVLRPAEEVQKAYDKFKQLGKLPITIRHPDEFLDHKDTNIWKNGQAENPELKRIAHLTTIDCNVDIKNEGINDYEAGTKELSCGWSGEFIKADHGPCEFIQIFHDINHIAIVPAGRCGPMCRINDAITNGGKKTMITVFDKVMSFLKLKKIELSDEDKEVLGVLTKDQEPEEDPDKMKDKKKKKKAKDEDPDEPDKTEDEDEEEEEKENKDKKKKNKDQAVIDAAIKDAYEKGQKDLKDKFLAGMNDVMPIMNEFKGSEIKDKTPCEIKAMFIKKMTDEDIKDSDPALNAIFKMVMKNYEHPAYRNAQRTDVIDEKIADVAAEISSLNFNKTEEVK